MGALGAWDVTALHSFTGIYLLWHIIPVLETLTAIAEPNRFRIVELLRDGPRAVGDIGGTLRLQQTLVSKHLRVLRDAGLVEVQPRAQHRLSQLTAAPLHELSDWLERFRGIWDKRFRELDAYLIDMQTKGPARRRRSKT
jgi:DNA-binding transcriptional ArsR family regulator